MGVHRSFQFAGPAIMLFVKGTAKIIGEKNHDVVSAEAFYTTPGEKFEVVANSDLYFVIANVP